MFVNETREDLAADRLLSSRRATGEPRNARNTQGQGNLIRLKRQPIATWKEQCRCKNKADAIFY